MLESLFRWYMLCGFLYGAYLMIRCAHAEAKDDVVSQLPGNARMRSPCTAAVCLSFIGLAGVSLLCGYWTATGQVFPF